MSSGGNRRRRYSEFGIFMASFGPRSSYPGKTRAGTHQGESAAWRGKLRHANGLTYRSLSVLFLQ